MKIYFALISILFATISFSQEICDNGIDDDNDGLIDLNDPDCNCGAICDESVTSLIPNFNFENFSSCPTNASQMSKCNGWMLAAVNADADYYNNCGYTNFLPLPTKGSPCGDGYIGFYDYSNVVETYKEYAATCLPTALFAGTEYKLTFRVGFTSGQLSSLPQTEVAIIGTSNCANFPYNSRNCPTIGNPNFTILGKVTVSGVDEWVNTEITFTPAQNIQGIAIGPSEVPAPVAYWGHYYYLDGLVLNEKKLFKNNSPNATIKQEGNYCANNLNLKIELQLNETVQWYKNGIAIVGETQKSLKIDTSDKSKFQCVITTANGDCVKPSIFSLENQKQDCKEVIVFVPNGFTPNGDGKNDFFGPSISDYSKINAYHIQIFSRWGELVFDSRSPDLLWDGKFKNSDASDGIYIWKLTYKPEGTKVISKIGHLSLLR